jgi:hypothetical protein
MPFSVKEANQCFFYPEDAAEGFLKRLTPTNYTLSQQKRFQP